MLHQPIDVVWTLICGILVFVMQAGFMCLEVGLVRQKNSINVAIKNVVDFLISSISFFLVGFALMFGTSFQGLIGTDGWFLAKYIHLDQQGWIYTFWFFQVVFCGAAATIVSGGVAERMKFFGYMLISFVISTLIYPVFGHWAWGGLYDLAPAKGWLAALGYKDFSGSSVVHMVGGVTTLACLLVLGPRKGRYKPDGSANNIFGCDIPMSTLGLFLLWFGWLGFNGGSSFAVNKDIGRIIVNTNLSACSGGLISLFLVWRERKNLDVGTIINGCLGGLVAITASCAFVTPVSALIIGGLAGVVVRSTDKLLNRWHIDDAVGAVPVHGACGILGVLSVGFFAESAYLIHNSRLEQILVQALGAGVCFLYTFAIAWLIIKGIDKYIMKLRVSSEIEDVGLNISEHGARTYWYDLTGEIHQIEKTNDLNKRVTVEPETEAGIVALMVNRLMVSLQQKTGEIKEAQIKLFEQGKMASVGQLAAGIAHEINNPAGFINSNLQTLEQYLTNYAQLLRLVGNLKEFVVDKDIDKANSVVHEINKLEQEINFDFMNRDMDNLIRESKTGMERIKKIVLDLRSFARTDQEIVETVKVDTVIESILSIINSELKYKVELRKNYGDIPAVQCNQQKLGQVFINLLINAVQSIPQKGVIEITTYSKDGYVCVDVRDTGCGIEEKNLTKIFDAFFTTKPVGQGTGLGLNVSYAIIKKHEGDIKVKSKVGQGTIFTVRLPINSKN